MTTQAFPVPAQIGRLQQMALVAGAVGTLACAAGGFANPGQFFRSYLFGFLFWTGVGLGCLSLSMIHHLSGGAWGLLIRRILEAGARTLPYAALAFIPVAVGVKQIYVWASPAHDEAMREMLAKKEAYLNVPFFIGRAAFYFLAWSLLAHFLSKWSLEQESGGDKERLARRMRGVAGGGLLVMGLTITFASVDWAMSLEPHWFSTIYGVLFMVGQALSAMALVIALLSVIGTEQPLAGVISSRTVHDLGKLMFAFVMLWAYVNLSQFLIIWSGNLPEEIPWYIHRLSGGWQWMALVLVVFHFVLPFMLLLSRDLKRNGRALGLLAAGIFLVRLVDLYWLVGPELHGHGGFAVHWMDVAAAVGLGGLWLTVFAGQLKGRSLLATGDPEFAETFAAAGGH